MITLTYILRDKSPVAEPDQAAWWAWMRDGQADGRQTVAQTGVGDRFRVSTVFTGMDQGPAGSPGVPHPIVFESAVFEDEQLTQTHRYSDWQAAEDGHARLVAELGGARRH